MSVSLSPPPVAPSSGYIHSTSGTSYPTATSRGKRNVGRGRSVSVRAIERTREKSAVGTDASSGARGARDRDRGGRTRGNKQQQQHHQHQPDGHPARTTHRPARGAGVPERPRVFSRRAPSRDVSVLTTHQVALPPNLVHRARVPIDFALHTRRSRCPASRRYQKGRARSMRRRPWSDNHDSARQLRAPCKSVLRLRSSRARRRRDAGSTKNEPSYASSDPDATPKPRAAPGLIPG